jgi:hypothetical protein
MHKWKQGRSRKHRAKAPLLAGLLHVRCLSTAVLEGDPNAGYTVARIRYEIILAPEAIEDLRRLRANIRAAVRDALETNLRYTPTKPARAASSAFGACLGHNFACVSATSESFMM